MYFVIAISHMSLLFISLATSCSFSFANQHVNTMGTSCITLHRIHAVPLRVYIHSSLIFKWMEFFVVDYYYFHATDHRIASLFQFSWLKFVNDSRRKFYIYRKQFVDRRTVSFISFFFFSYRTKVNEVWLLLLLWIFAFLNR